MTVDEARTLKNGLYVLVWEDGGTSEAAVGRDPAGTPWYAPVNWVKFRPSEAGVPCQDWPAVREAVRVAPSAVHPRSDAGLVRPNLPGRGLDEELASQVDHVVLRLKELETELRLLGEKVG